MPLHSSTAVDFQTALILARRQNARKRRETVDLVVRLETQLVHLHSHSPEHRQWSDEIGFQAGLRHGFRCDPLNPGHLQPHGFCADGIPWIEWTRIDYVQTDTVANQFGNPNFERNNDRPTDTYQKRPLSTHNLSCETQPVQAFVPLLGGRDLLRRRLGIRSHAACTSGLSVRILIDRRRPLLAVEASGRTTAGTACLTGRPSLTG